MTSMNIKSLLERIGLGTHQSQQGHRQEKEIFFTVVVNIYGGQNAIAPSASVAELHSQLGDTGQT